MYNKKKERTKRGTVRKEGVRRTGVMEEDEEAVCSMWTWKLSTSTKAFNSSWKCWPQGVCLSPCLVLSTALLSAGNGIKHQRQVSARLSAQKHWQPHFHSALSLRHRKWTAAESDRERERVHMEPQSSGWMFLHLCRFTPWDCDACYTTIGWTENGKTTLLLFFTTSGAQKKGDTREMTLRKSNQRWWIHLSCNKAQTVAW